MNRRRFVLISCLVLFAIVAGLHRAEAAEKKDPSARWEPNIQKFETRDKEQFPPADGILFIGSSSIVGWDVKKYFPELPVYNRGFGGSQVIDSVHFADRIVVPYKPKTIVLYAGDNDIGAGKSPERVAADYKAFVAKVHAALPKTRIVYIAIKPSIRRWKLVDKVRAANALIATETEKDDRLVFVDIDAPMMGDDGMPRAELFKSDGLHMKPAGYELWTKLVRPHL